MRPTAGGPGVLNTKVGPKFAANGHPPAKLRLAQARRNLAEVERANASGTRPDEPPDIRISIYRARSAGGVLGACTNFALFKIFRTERPEGEVRNYTITETPSNEYLGIFEIGNCIFLDFFHLNYHQNEQHQVD
jgi:hypothetical protein